MAANYLKRELIFIDILYIVRRHIFQYVCKRREQLLILSKLIMLHYYIHLCHQAITLSMMILVFSSLVSSLGVSIVLLTTLNSYEEYLDRTSTS